MKKGGREQIKHQTLKREQSTDTSEEKKDTTICCPREIHFRYKDLDRKEVKGQRQKHDADTDPKEAGVAVCVSDNADFRAQTLMRDKEGLVIRGSVSQGNVTIPNMYVPDKRPGKIRQNTNSTDRGSRRICESWRVRGSSVSAPPSGPGNR